MTDRADEIAREVLECPRCKVTGAKPCYLCDGTEYLAPPQDVADALRAYGDECRNAALEEVERAIQNYQGRETGRTLLETIRALKEKP